MNYLQKKNRKIGKPAVIWLMIKVYKRGNGQFFFIGDAASLEQHFRKFRGNGRKRVIFDWIIITFVGCPVIVLDL